MRKLVSPRVMVLTSFLIFAVGILTGVYYCFNQTDQWRHYMLGRMAYTATQYDTAIDDFDLSYSDYQQMVSAGQSVFSAPPSLEMAELSQHFKALALVKEGTEGSMKMAVLTFKEALRLTTADALKAAGLDENMVRKIGRDRSFTQQDLEILFHNQPKQAEKEGKGRAKPGDGSGDKKSDDPAGNQAGKENREQL
jgi:hypothetical protein